MGMSASQARLLALTQRMSDIEFQGQQINQQRTTLSNQINALYNSLLEMDVPTPPSTNDFQKVVYSGSLGATKYNFEANDVIPKGENTYSIKIGQTGYGNTISATTGFSKVESGKQATISGSVFVPTITGEQYDGGAGGLTTVDTGREASVSLGSQLAASDLEAAFKGGKQLLYLSGGVYFQVSAGEAIQQNTDANGKVTYSIKSGYGALFNQGGSTKLYNQKLNAGTQVCDTSQMGNLYVQDADGVHKATAEDFDGKTADGKYKLKSGVTYIDTSAGDTPYTLKGASSLTVDGKGVYTFEALESAGVEPETITAYKEAIANSDMQDDRGRNYTWQDFYVILSEEGTASFALKSDVDDGNDNCSTYAYEPNGEYTTKQTFDGCKLQFDPSNGRISSIGIPNYDEFGNITSYTNIRLESKLEQDEEKYQDAMADYNYEKALYDKKQEEINKKTEIIQQEDKNLELKLTRLDNERTAVNTEIEAVKKVIGDNIDKSFKVFSN